MKKLLTLTALFAAPVFANPYIGLEYGMATTDHDFEPVVNGQQLNPESDEGMFGAFVGYQFNNNWGLELGYRQFDMDDSKSTEVVEGGLEKESEWDADISAKQFTLMPIYTHSFNDQWSLKAGAGITYTQYDFNSSYSYEEEVIATDVDQNYQRTAGPSGSSNEFGGIASIGVEYAIIPAFTVGANAKYQADSYANTATFSVMTAYYF